MEDFNRISYVVKNLDKLRGLNYFAFGLIFSVQLIFPFLRAGATPDFLILIPFVLFVSSYGFMGLFRSFYKKSIGLVSNYPVKNNPTKAWLTFFVFLFFVVGMICTLMLNLTYFPTSIFWVGLLLFSPDLKENQVNRRYIFWIAAALFIVNCLPFSQFFSFKDQTQELNLKNSLYVTLFYLPVGILDHFTLLKLMRPLNAKTIKNTSVDHDTILGDPSNLTILAALANCQNADFVFLRKISQLEETDFYRRIYGLEQAGFLFTFQKQVGFNSEEITVAAITTYGWEIVTRIYNETRTNQGLPMFAPQYTT